MKDEAIGSVSAGLSYSIEIKDAYIPPWIISSICATMGSEGRSFEARYGNSKIHFALKAMNIKMVKYSKNNVPKAYSRAHYLGKIYFRRKFRSASKALSDS